MSSEAKRFPWIRRGCVSTSSGALECGTVGVGREELGMQHGAVDQWLWLFDQETLVSTNFSREQKDERAIGLTGEEGDTKVWICLWK